MKKFVKVTYQFENEDRINLKVWCIQKRLTLDALAKKLGISMSYLSALMDGSRVVTGEMMCKFREVGFDYEKR